MKASFSEQQDWETEETGVNMDFDMEIPLQGLVATSCFSGIFSYTENHLMV